MSRCVRIGVCMHEKEIRSHIHVYVRVYRCMHEKKIRSLLIAGAFNHLFTCPRVGGLGACVLGVWVLVSI